MSTTLGIDVSTYQKNLKDINAVKAAGYEFAIIKIGEYFTKEDSCFEQHYKNLTSAGVPVGVYLFSHAESRASAVKEAEFALRILNGRPLQLPVFIDIEAKDSALAAGRDECMNIANAFCEVIESAGYMAGIYASASPWKTHLNPLDAKAHNRCVWVAYYSAATPTTYGVSHYDIWQYSPNGVVAGCVTDLNIMANTNYIKETPIDVIAEKLDEIAEEEIEEISARTAQRLIAIAANEIGYREKASNSQLDDKTANWGGNNYTKYARDLAKAGYYQASKQGFAWCDMFVDWCFWILCGKDKSAAEAMECQTGVFGAGCPSSADYYRKQGRLDRNPQAGDQIFFGTPGAETHTGIVEYVADGMVHTIEGNTSDCVARRSYKLGSGQIAGYGHPYYESEKPQKPEEIQKPQIEEEPTIETVNTSSGAEGFINLYMEQGLIYSNAVKAMQALLTYRGFPTSTDGYFGPDTKKMLLAFQKVNHLTEDAICGKECWLKLLEKG